MLELLGHRVAVAHDGTRGIELARTFLPEAVLCDIGLPGEDGHEFIRKVRALEAERGGRIPALALTAYAGREARRKALAAGFDLHVPKPAEPADLVTKVAALAASCGRN